MTDPKELIDLAEWEDPRVQLVYKILCDDVRPPDDDEHWEGFVARRIVAALASLSASVGVTDGWRPIETAPKNRKVLAGYFNSLGNWRTITACYHTELPWSEEFDHNDGFAPEGWYEESDRSETIYLTSSPPSHWQPLPDKPGALSLPSSGGEVVGYVSPHDLQRLAACSEGAWVGVGITRAPNSFATAPLYARATESGK